MKTNLSKPVHVLNQDQMFSSGIGDVIDAVLEARSRAGGLDLFALPAERREKFVEFLGAIDSAVEVLVEVYDDCAELPVIEADDLGSMD